MECPICLDVKRSLFNNKCGHSWCKACHEKLLQVKHVTCVICREPITLHRPLTPKNAYIDWLLKGGQPLLYPRKKRKKKYKYKHK